MRTKSQIIENKLNKADYFMSKLVWIIIPFLFFGIFKGNDSVNLMCSLLLLILSVTQLVFVLIDT